MLDTTALLLRRDIAAQALEDLHMAIAEWREATGAYRLVCARYGLRLFRAWRFHRHAALYPHGREA